MVSPITSATPTDPTTASAIQTQTAAKSATKTEKSTPSQPPAATADSVQISNAAQTALKEATETPTQTAKEAQSGDHQAQRLLAKEVAAK
jgi:hypothetical protein